MVAPIYPLREQGEPEVRLRRGLFGGLVVQVRYPLTRLASLHSPKNEWVEAGKGPWRDVKATNLHDTLAAVKKLGCSVK